MIILNIIKISDHEKLFEQNQDMSYHLCQRRIRNSYSFEYFVLVLSFSFSIFNEWAGENDDLNLDEIEIWEGSLKWCFTQQNMMNNQDTTKIVGY